jgi:hypothetical protein
MDQLLRTLHDARTQLTRRLLVGLALVAPFAARQAQAADRVTFADLWSEAAEFSNKAKDLAGKTVEMRGYMAPPLKPEVDFFVLASEPQATCPFCDDAAAWPEDIVLVMLHGPRSAQAYNRAIKVTGILDIGTQTDAKTGFVSRVRLQDSKFTYA